MLRPMAGERQFKALVAVGKDRPGLVHGISALIHGAGANLEDSRMAVLGGEFAMLLLCSGNREQLARLEQQKDDVGRKLGLELSLRDTVSPSERAKDRARLEVSGLDRPGIVDAVSRVLAHRDVNVESLQTELRHQPLTGTAIFVLEAEIRLPATLSRSELEAELAPVCDSEQLELSIEPIG
jgi:glycine cleavage system transcriptional repressor